MARLETRLDSLARSLASFRPERGVCVSLFLDLDPSVVPTAKDLSSHVRSVVDDGRRRVDELSDELAHEQEVAAREDLDRALAFLEEDLDRSGAAGFALFISGFDDAWHEVPLSTPVRDAAHVGRTFVLVPLLESLERDRELILAAVGRERGTVWRSRSGRTELLEDRTEEIGRRHDQGGWSQARLQRSVDEDALDHLRDVAEVLAHTIQPGSGALLLVACVEEQRPKFEALLAPHVREALVGWSTVEAHAREDALEPEAQRLLAARLERERADLLERWREASANGDRAASTWAEAIEAAADGAVDVALVDGRSPEAWICPMCDRGSLTPGSCPLDGTELVVAAGGALELVVRGTIANAGQVRRVETLPDTEGIAALLRFPVSPSARSESN
jgi:peptide chain release factor subunit 1